MALTILIPAFIFFLFSLYLLSRENYLFLRRNISSEQVFNIAFIAFAIGIIFARVIFILFHWRFMYTNPLVFILFPYFPGLSLAGGILGVLLFLWLASIEERMPLGSIVDVFAISFLTSYLFSKFVSIVQSLVVTRHSILSDVIIFSLAVICFVVMIRIYRSNKWKDGLIGLLILFFFSLSVLIKNIVFLKHISPFILRDELLYIVLLVLSIVFIVSISNAFDKRKRV